MTEIVKTGDARDLKGYYLLEGLPGVGLVAKIAADYIIEKLDMEQYAEVYSEDLPQIPVFESDKPGLNPPVRIFVDPDNRLAVLKSDVPVSSDSRDFAEAIVDWISSNEMKPIFQVGLPVDVEEGEHFMFHVESGEFPGLEGTRLDDPPVAGAVTGPTGTLLEQTLKEDVDALALIIESDPGFPDPRASSIVIDKGLEPVTGIEIDTRQLEESADEIREQKKKLVERLEEMRQQRSSEAYPREMYE